MAYNVLQQFNEMIATIAMEDVDRNHDFVCEVVSLFAKHYGEEFKVEVATLATHAVALFGYSAFRPRVTVCDRRIRPIYKLLNTYSLPLPDLKKILEENWVDLASFMYDNADMCILRKDFHTAKKILTEMEDAVGQHHEKVEELREYITEQETQKNTKLNAGTPPPSSTPLPPRSAKRIEFNPEISTLLFDRNEMDGSIANALEEGVNRGGETDENDDGEQIEKENEDDSEDKADKNVSSLLRSPRFSNGNVADNVNSSTPVPALKRGRNSMNSPLDTVNSPSSTPKRARTQSRDLRNTMASSQQSPGTVKKSGSKKRGRPSTASEAARKKDKKKKELKKNGGRKTGVQKKKCTMKKQPNIEKALEKTRKR